MPMPYGFEISTAFFKAPAERLALVQFRMAARQLGAALLVGLVAVL
jgi:hypothetical protein